MSYDTQDLYNVRACTLVSATLNRTFPNIYSPINRFILRWINGGGLITDVRLVIPPAQYTTVTLPVALQTAIQAATPLFAGVTVGCNTTTNRFQFLWDGTGGATQIQLVPLGSNPENELAPYIGLTSFETLPPSVLL
jgi:hypothetical protein